MKTERLTQDRISKIFDRRSLSVSDENTMPKTENMRDGIQPSERNRKILRLPSNAKNTKYMLRMRSRTP